MRGAFRVLAKEIFELLRTGRGATFAFVVPVVIVLMVGQLQTREPMIEVLLAGAPICRDDERGESFLCRAREAAQEFSGTRLHFRTEIEPDPLGRLRAGGVDLVINLCQGPLGLWSLYSASADANRLQSIASLAKSVEYAFAVLALTDDEARDRCQALRARGSEGKDPEIDEIAFSADGTYAVTVVGDDATFWDPATLSPSAVLAEVIPRKTTATERALGPRQVRDATSGELLLELPGPEHRTSDGARRLQRKSATEFRLADDLNQEVAILAQDAAVVSARFSPDGTRVVTASRDGAAALWSAETGERLNTLRHGDFVLSARFSPDSQRIGTASYDRTARIWNAGDGSLVFALEHNAPVAEIVFSTGGESVATLAWDRTARVWNSTTGEPLTPPLEHVAVPRDAALGRLLLTLDASGVAHLWDPARATELGSMRASPPPPPTPGEGDASPNRTQRRGPAGILATLAATPQPRTWHNFYGQALERDIRLLPMTIALVTCFLPFVLASSRIIRERDLRTLDVLLSLRGIGARSVFVGGCTFPVAITLTTFLILVLAVEAAYDLRIKADLPLIILVAAPAILSSSLLGFLVSCIAKSYSHAVLGSAYYLLALVLLGGFVFSAEEGSAVIQVLSMMLPLTFVKPEFENWMFGARIGSATSRDVLAMVAQCLAFGVLAVLAFRSALRRL
jgi:hypothetical protein